MLSRDHHTSDSKRLKKKKKKKKRTQIDYEDKLAFNLSQNNFFVVLPKKKLVLLFSFTAV